MANKQDEADLNVIARDVELIKNVMNLLALRIDSTLNQFLGKKGFALIVFDFFGPCEGHYISNAERSAMIKTLRKTADRIEKNETMPPVFPRVQ